MVHIGLQIFLDAWRELNLERAEYNYTSVQRISREQIRNWLIDNNKVKDHIFAAELRAHIFALENVFLPFERKRRQNEVNKQRAKNHGKGKPK